MCDFGFIIQLQIEFALADFLHCDNFINTSLFCDRIFIASVWNR